MRSTQFVLVQLRPPTPRPAQVVVRRPGVLRPRWNFASPKQMQRVDGIVVVEVLECEALADILQSGS